MNYRFNRKKSIRKADADVLRRLRAFLDATEPELVAFLVNLWHAQGRALTYKELREAILRGDVSPAMIAQWQQEYARFVQERLRPEWDLAMVAATQELEARFDWRFDPMGAGVQQWTDARAAEFVTSCTDDQIAGLRALIHATATLEDHSVDELSRLIRPLVGLYHGQAVANVNYYNSLLAGGMSREKAKDKAIRYAARQHRYRAFMIARTELAFAYNQGAYQGTKQAQEEGFLPPDMVKVWATARDERVCDVCGGLNGVRVGIDYDFPFDTKLTASMVRRMPPAHPNCRCAVKFVEAGR